MEQSAGGLALKQTQRRQTDPQFGTNFLNILAQQQLPPPAAATAAAAAVASIT